MSAKIRKNLEISGFPAPGFFGMIAGFRISDMVIGLFLRQYDYKPSPFGIARVKLHVSAHYTGKHAGDGKAEPCALCILVELDEPVKYRIFFVGFYSDSCVRDAKYHSPVVRINPIRESDRAFCGELGGICQKV